MRVLFIIGISFLQFVFISQANYIPKRSEDSLKSSQETFSEVFKEKTERNNDFVESNKNISRVSRGNKEQTGRVKNVTKVNPITKPKASLVKKPIPKFAESDEDYQTKVRFPNKFSDSVEHEDEDFNLDDYDFDVNHDEFSSGGKPLEPRKKNKISKPRVQLEQSPAKLESKLKSETSQRKVVIPRNVDKVNYKITRKSVYKLKEEEYDDEFSTSTKEPTSTKSSTTEDDQSEEGEESREYVQKGSARIIRSPLSFGAYVNKWGEKTSHLMNKILTYLPLFPQVQMPKKIEENDLEMLNPVDDTWNRKVRL